jgi:hypothetical protein
MMICVLDAAGEDFRDVSVSVYLLGQDLSTVAPANEPGATRLPTSEALADMRVDPGSAFGRPGRRRRSEARFAIAATGRGADAGGL